MNHLIHFATRRGTGYEIFFHALLEKLAPSAERQLDNYHKSDSGKASPSVRMILESLENKMKTHHLSIDFKAAYDGGNYMKP